MSAVLLTLDPGILARHAGSCVLCPQKIVKGESVIVPWRDGYAHEDCARAELEERESRWTREYYAAHDGAELAQLLRDSGLLFRINYTVLAEVGLKLSVTLDENEDVTGLLLSLTTDDDVRLDPDAVERGRQKLRDAGLLTPAFDLARPARRRRAEEK